jgi:hypothetical protein
MPKTALAAFFGWLIIYLKENMALPGWFTDALAEESAQGQALQAQITRLTELRVADQATLAIQAEKINELTAMTAGMADLQARVTELSAQNETLQANAINREEAEAAIAAINPSPVGDAVVTEVIDNPDVETPDVVESAPEVAPEVVQSPEVVVAAAEALGAIDEL